MEQIVIVRPDIVDNKSRELLGKIRRTQEFSEKVFVVEGSRDSITELCSLPGVKTPLQLTPTESNQLSDAERLSIEAWTSPADRQAKVRPGDGLGWGHKDFEPPR